MRAALAIVAIAFASACGQPSTPAGTAATEAAPIEAAETAVLSVEQGTAHATPNGAKVAAGYLTIQNPTAEADRLIAAASPRAATVELHEMAMDGAMMTMRKVDGVDAPAGGSVVLAPGGLHLMFIDIDAPFLVGQTVPVALTFEKAGTVMAELPVVEGTPGAH